MAEIVASGVLPFRPAQRPESITRLATSFALSGPAAARSTSIATRFADSPFTAFCFAIADGLLLLVVVLESGGAATRSRAPPKFRRGGHAPARGRPCAWPALDNQHAAGGRLPVAAQIVGSVARLDDGRDRVLERARPSNAPSPSGVSVSTPSRVSGASLATSARLDGSGSANSGTISAVRDGDDRSRSCASAR